MRSLAVLLSVLAFSVLPVPVVADDVPPVRAAQPADPGPAAPGEGDGDASELPSTETDAQVFGLIGATALVLGGSMIFGSRALRRRRDDRSS